MLFCGDDSSNAGDSLIIRLCSLRHETNSPVCILRSSSTLLPPFCAANTAFFQFFAIPIHPGVWIVSESAKKKKHAVSLRKTRFFLFSIKDSIAVGAY